jgi:hypothetical protein
VSESEDQSGGRQAGGKQSGGKPNKPNKPSDPVGDFQRWLMRAGARSMANQVADNVRRTLGQPRRSSSGDVWDTATTEPPPDEPPECQWCPVCQAARRLRESGPGLSAKLADAGGVLATVVQDAFVAVDQFIKTQDLSAERASANPPARNEPTAADSGGDDPPAPPRPASGGI